VKPDRVPTVGLNQQSGLNCTGCEPSDASRATAESMVRQRSTRRTPLYLMCDSQRLDGAGRFRGPIRPGFMFWAGERDLFAFGGDAPPPVTAPNHQG
jgi:hypothetical protein